MGDLSTIVNVKRKLSFRRSGATEKSLFRPRGRNLRFLALLGMTVIQWKLIYSVYYIFWFLTSYFRLLIFLWLHSPYGMVLRRH